MCDDNLSWFSTSLTSHPSFVISLLFHISHFHTTATMLSTLNWSEKSWKFTIFTFNLHCYKVLSLFSLSLQLNLLCTRDVFKYLSKGEQASRPGPGCLSWSFQFNCWVSGRGHLFSFFSDSSLRSSVEMLRIVVWWDFLEKNMKPKNSFFRPRIRSRGDLFWELMVKMMNYDGN